MIWTNLVWKQPTVVSPHLSLHSSSLIAVMPQTHLEQLKLTFKFGICWIFLLCSSGLFFIVVKHFKIPFFFFLTRWVTVACLCVCVLDCRMSSKLTWCDKKVNHLSDIWVERRIFLAVDMETQKWIKLNKWKKETKLGWSWAVAWKSGRTVQPLLFFPRVKVVKTTCWRLSKTFRLLVLTKQETGGCKQRAKYCLFVCFL